MRKMWAILIAISLGWAVSACSKCDIPDLLPKIPDLLPKFCRNGPAAN
jgi:hypothetical protein